MVFVCVNKLKICCRAAPIDISFSFNFTADSSLFAAKLKKATVLGLRHSSVIRIGEDHIFFFYLVAYLSSYHEKAIKALYELA